MLELACQQGDIRLLDLHLGLFLEKLAGHKQPELLLAGVLASTAVWNGHICQPLNELSGISLHLHPSLIPDPETWRKILLATSVVGRPGETMPLILDDHNRLYLYRYYQYEEYIAHDLRKRAEGILKVDTERAHLFLKQLFPFQTSTHSQQLAATLALIKPLLVISGGPGTGKTWTVAKILALIQALAKKPLRIGLAAPTGKAAARLEKSIRKASKFISPELNKNIPEQAQTLHRLLGFRPGADDFRYNQYNHLHLDLLVLDEASMIDVVLMNGLLKALPAKTRLIFLGDQNQLASVEAGSLFADLCGTEKPAWSAHLCDQICLLTKTNGLTSASPASPIADSVIQLRTSYRFKDTSGIGALAKAVNNGSIKRVTSVLDKHFSDLKVKYITGDDRETWLRKQILHGFHNMLKATLVEEAFSAMEKFRVLCAVRKGPAGVEGINTMAHQVLCQADMIGKDTDWYRGKPIIIRRNHYEMQLFNGDAGILWPDTKGQLRAWFRRPDNHLHPFPPGRLPDHDTAYGITIHKAQGSEFDKVLLLLPEEDSRILSRELIYTGITRARSRLILCCTPKSLATAVKLRTRRHSGLRKKLWQL
jgi:exodeoxyribonuclease V alpha subunit